MGAAYEDDAAAWAFEQARLIRAGEFDKLDLVHIADEIEDVGRSERREIVSRMAVLLAHLLKWQMQPAFRSRSWELTIRDQRRRVLRALGKLPSLRPMLTDDEWIVDMWDDAVTTTRRETGLEAFPVTCPWSLPDVLRDDWMPPQ